MAIALGMLPVVTVEAICRWWPPPPIEAVDLTPTTRVDAGPLFIADDADQMQTDPKRLNFFFPQRFSLAPAAGRIFVIGGSTVAGRPWATETSMTAWLQSILSVQQPDDEFDVVNVGGVSYASYRLEHLLSEVLNYDPAAVVIYSGHNEFLESRTYAAATPATRSSRLLSSLADRSAFVQRIKHHLARRRRSDHSPESLAAEVDTRLDHRDGMSKFVRDDWLSRRTVAEFEQTLDRMVKRCRQRNVPVVLCEPASEIVATPPFKSTLPNDVDLRLPRWQNATKLQSNLRDLIAERPRRWSSIETIAKELMRLDPRHADAQHFYAAAKLHRGDAAGLKTHFQNARDFDVCPLRATSEIIDAVQNVAKNNEVPLVPTISMLDHRDMDGHRRPDGVADQSYFVDHVHPTTAAHQIIARQIYVELQRLGVAKAKPLRERAIHEAFAAQIAALDEAYFIRGQQRLEGLRRWARLRSPGSAESSFGPTSAGSSEFDASATLPLSASPETDRNQRTSSDQG